MYTHSEVDRANMRGEVLLEGATSTKFITRSDLPEASGGIHAYPSMHLEVLVLA